MRGKREGKVNKRLKLPENKCGSTTDGFGCCGEKLGTGGDDNRRLSTVLGTRLLGPRGLEGTPIYLQYNGFVTCNVIRTYPNSFAHLFTVILGSKDSTI